MKGHTNQLAADLDAWRREHGYSLVEAGKHFGVSGPGFHYWVAGTHPPTRHLDVIADTLEIEEWEAYRRLRTEPEDGVASASGAIPGWLTLRPTIRASANLLTFPAFPPPPKVAAA